MHHRSAGAHKGESERIMPSIRSRWKNFPGLARVITYVSAFYKAVSRKSLRVPRRRGDRRAVAGRRSLKRPL